MCREVKLKDYTVFPNAPITEALLDIRVELPKEITLKNLELFQEGIKKSFPEKKTRVFFKAQLPTSGALPTSIPTSGGPDGYLFRSPHEQKIVQARLDGFTFNKLKPYENWAVFRKEAQGLWDQYYKIASPIRVTRIALRYINRIEIPLPLRDFKDYILTTPEIAPDLPQALEHFFMQLVIPYPEAQVKAVITQTMQNPTKDNRLPLILDIDVWQEVNYEGQANEMWAPFEKLREIKNDIFQKSITDKAKELFK
jgi:uncharacterized protein (TIGR04255 family)